MTKPILTLRDGLLAASIWKNTGEDGKTRYSVTLTRSYNADGQWRDTNSFSRLEALRISRLAGFAYDEILMMVETDRRQDEQP